MATTNKPTQRFTELARARVTEARDVVLSKTQSGTVLMAQQLKACEGKRVHNIFLQGAFELPTVEAMVELRNALDLAILEMDPESKM